MNPTHAFQVNLRSLKFAGHRSSLANLFAFIAGVVTGLRIKGIFKKEMLSTLNHVILCVTFCICQTCERKSENWLYLFVQSNCFKCRIILGSKLHTSVSFGNFKIQNPFKGVKGLINVRTMSWEVLQFWFYKIDFFLSYRNQVAPYDPMVK